MLQDVSCMWHKLTGFVNRPPPPGRDKKTKQEKKELKGITKETFQIHIEK